MKITQDNELPLVPLCKLVHKLWRSAKELLGCPGKNVYFLCAIIIIGQQVAQERRKEPSNRHFRPQSGHSNERAFCISIDRASNMQFSKRSGSFLQLTILLKPILHFFEQKMNKKNAKTQEDF